ncbi:hypothetical protein ACS0TY_017140 [Phlomoides rotata]
MKHYVVALSVFDEMPQMGSPVDEYKFNTAINCSCLRNRLEFGFANLAIIFKSHYKSDCTTFSILIKDIFYNIRSLKQ